MISDFFTRALIAGVGVAMLAGPFGCFIVWRRLAYFGDSLSHAALLGIALALFTDLPPMLGVALIALMVSVVLVTFQQKGRLASDTILGLIAPSALALGLIMLASLPNPRIDLMGWLIGDILSVSMEDIYIIYGGGALLIIGLLCIWRGLFATTVNRELAAAEGFSPQKYEFYFLVLLAFFVAMALKIVGALLVTALLIIPATSARLWVKGPEAMVILASIFGGIAAIAGLFASLNWDLPSGPAIVVACLGLFLIGVMRSLIKS